MNLRLLAVALLASVPAGAARPPPGIVFIQADDLGWSDPGCQGNAFIETPAIDGLARTGLRFTQAYAGAPICTPNRAALITGRHAARLHVTGQPGYKTEDASGRKFLHPDFRTDLPRAIPSFGRTLAAAGYRCLLFGKWGLDNPPEAFGFAAAKAADDDTLAASAVAALLENRDRPFLLFFNPVRPHVPLQPPPDLRAKYRDKPNPSGGVISAAYAAEVEALDRSVAVLLLALDQLDLAARTVVVFSSDNGGFLGFDGESVASNAPLREGKASLYEGGIRVPLIVRWPGVTRPGAICTVPVHAVDWHATLAEMAGATAPETDGRSLVPQLRGATTDAERILFWHYPHYRRSRSGLAASPSSALRAGDWKLLHFYETNGVELYDLSRDPGEARNLATVEPRRAATLRAELDRWRSAVGAQPPVANPNITRAQ